MLERLLQARFPDRQFEVINVAMTAINSHVILPIARDCARREGDLWVIYMGNNEVVGPFGPGTGLGSRALSLPIIRTSIALKTTRVGQLLDVVLDRLGGVSGRALYWKGMELMAQGHIRRSDPRMTGVYGNFRRNLQEILRTGDRAGVPILLCSVGVNLQDCPPFASLHRPDLTPADEAAWKDLYTAGVALETAGRWAEATARYQEAGRRDDGFAELHFRLARCWLALGRDAEAREHFQRAADEDALRFRADSQINRIIRETAAAWSDRAVRLLDAEEMFSRSAPRGIPEFFYEHVHFTPEGNYRLARATAEAVESWLFTMRTRKQEASTGAGADPNAPQGSPRAETKREVESATSWLSKAECEAQLGYTEWNESQALRLVLDRLQLPPFVGTVGHSNRLARLQRQVNQLVAGNQPANFLAQADGVRRGVAAHPRDWMLRENLGLLLSMARDMAGANEQLREAIRLMPHAPGPYFSLAGVLALQGQTEEAVKYYQECLRLAPDNFGALTRLGIVELSRRRFPDAIAYFHAAIRAKPDSVSARMYLGGALFQEKRAVEAQEQFREVLRLEPENNEARRLPQTAGGTN
jgi:tetratricopeptide (TPR) repeat protein